MMNAVLFALLALGIATVLFSAWRDVIRHIDFKKLSAQYKAWQADHPKLAGLVVLVESTAIGAAADVFTNGVDFSKNGLKHAAVIISTSVVVAVRNYLKSNANDLKLKLQAQAESK